MSDKMNLGMGVMIGMLGGNETTVQTVQRARGRKIASITLTDNELRLSLDDGYALRIWDGGQSCCESRYMRTDDDLASFVGAEVREFILREAPSISDEYGDEMHEVQFFVIETDKGNITFSNHNEHNGYYGGFWMEAAPLEVTDAER